MNNQKPSVTSYVLQKLFVVACDNECAMTQSLLGTAGVSGSPIIGACRNKCFQCRHFRFTASPELLNLHNPAILNNIDSVRILDAVFQRDMPFVAEHFGNAGLSNSLCAIEYERRLIFTARVKNSCKRAGQPIHCYLTGKLRIISAKIINEQRFCSFNAVPCGQTLQPISNDVETAPSGINRQIISTKFFIGKLGISFAQINA